MFGVSAFINYTIAVAVWTRFCFHVFLTSCAICGAFLSGICILGWLAGAALDHADGSV
jgi:hypothetical protein